MKTILRLAVLSLAVAAVGLSILLSFSAIEGQVSFNQRYIDDLDRLHGLSSTSARIARTRSDLSARLSSFFDKPAVPTNFDDVPAVFEYVLAHTPPYAIVHTTEMYYYYSFDMPGTGRIAGNLRLVEAKNLRVGCGYYPVSDPAGRSAHKLFSVVDGLRVEWLDERHVRLTFRGIQRTFRLSDLADRPITVGTREGEEVVATVRDESGVIFVLLFHAPTRSFYYALDEQQPPLEHLIALDDEIEVGERTGFAFFLDKSLKRRILFGVRQKAVQDNNYFDGPFDQVPPFLNLRDRIYLAYPYTKFGGVDLYGNFLNSETTRVAISPYDKYKTPSDLEHLLSDCRAGKRPMNEDLLSCLTYEEKREFHKDSPMFTPEGDLLPPEKRRPANTPPAEPPSAVDGESPSS